ncbi:hypothetical protein C8N46_104363 [Kordia periserrulae]|uniref:Peptidoglycan-binding protein LysM n=1 Tax=Kordia periserrulae TaxID=701523 RepID=A0A2T6C075_9FLAO|nr:hypothetical protein [Kordia periserrulae]PTX61719.1 hypothetical protein C8N46_104363 [Kordia periserrulae]
MVKKAIKFSILVAVLTFISLGFTSKKEANVLKNTSKKNTKSSELFTVNPTDDSSFQEAPIPFTGQSYLGFKEAVAFKESQGNYFVVNTLGYLGKYQFGKATLEMIGIYNPQAFLNNPKLQEKAFEANASRNKWILRKDIQRSVGKQINGVIVTESGILAAAHLAGPGSVKKYLRSGGKQGFSDAYGTTVKYYMKRFAGYDVSSIKANRKAKARV